MYQRTFDWTARPKEPVGVAPQNPVVNPYVRTLPPPPRQPQVVPYFYRQKKEWQRLVDGEYKRVALWSSRRDLLEKAHSTPCTMQQAKDLLDVLAKANNVRVTLRWKAGKSRE